MMPHSTLSHTDRYATRLYRLLVRAYPRAFREEYAAEMLLTFADACDDAARQGGRLGALGLWRDVFCDLVTSVCVQHARSWARRNELNGRHGQSAALAGTQQAALALRFTLDVAQRSDVGRIRANNEDSALAVVPDDHHLLRDKGAIFVVSDGMGGRNVGEVASALAVQTVRESFYATAHEDIPAALRDAFQAANTALRQASAHGPTLGATCIAAVVRDQTLTVANVGDSRAYVLHDGQLRQITRDHSLVAQLVERGEITPAEARTHPQRHLIYRSIDTPEVEVDCFVEPVQVGDSLVLCTDGLSGVVEDAEIGAIVGQYGTEESAQRLIAYANARGGPDNITVVVVHIASARQGYDLGQREDIEGAYAAD